MVCQRAQARRCVLHGIVVAAFQHIRDQALQAHFLAVFGRVDAGNAVGFELANFGRDDDTTATGEDTNVRASALSSACRPCTSGTRRGPPGRSSARWHARLPGPRRDDFGDRAIVTEVNDFGARRLQDAAHDIDRGIVPIEQAGGGDEANLARLPASDGMVDHLFRCGTHMVTLSEASARYSGVALRGVLNYLTLTLTSTTFHSHHRDKPVFQQAL